MILTEKLFKVRAVVGKTPQPALIIHAAAASAADTVAVLHYADSHPGEEVRILALSEIDTEAM